MDKLLPPLLILLAVGGAVTLILRGVRRSRASLEEVLTGGEPAAAEATARLTEEQHRTVFSFIAQGQPAQAIAAYRQATSCALGEARNAVVLMSRFPQPYRPARPSAGPPGIAPEQPGAGHAAIPTSHGAAAGANTPQRDEAAVSVPMPTDDDDDAPERFAYRYRAIVSNGRETREVASNMLNDSIYADIKELAQLGDAEDAAQMLRRHSDITIEDARAFISLL